MIFSMRLAQLSEFAQEIYHSDDVIQFLQTLLTLRPDTLEARRLLRTLEVDLWEETIRSRNPMKRIHAKALSLSTHSLLSQAEKSLKEHQYGQAMTHAEEALATQPCHEKANRILAAAAKALQMPSTVAFAYEMICYAKEDDPIYLHLLAEAHATEGDAESARHLYQHLLTLNPEDDDAHDALEQLRNTPQTTTECVPPEFAFTVTPREAEAFPFAQTEAQLESWQKQIHNLENEAIFEPKIRSEIMALQEKCAQTQLQILYHRAAQNPEDHTLGYELGQAYLQLNMFTEAKSVFTALLEEEDLRLACFKSLCQSIAQELVHQEAIDHSSLTLSKGPAWDEVE